MHVLAGWKTGHEVTGHETMEEMNVSVEIATDDEGTVPLTFDLAGSHDDLLRISQPLRGR